MNLRAAAGLLIALVNNAHNGKCKNRASFREARSFSMNPTTDQYCSCPEHAAASITELLPALSSCGVSLETRGMPWQRLLHHRREPAVPK